MPDLSASLPLPPHAVAPVTERLVCAQPGDSFELALVIKRTYRITNEGRCVLADEQLPIEAEGPDYDPDPKGSKASPPCWDSDLFAFKTATDVVIQGHAYAYGSRTTVDAELRIGSFSRVVRVIGDRRCEWSGGRVRFGSPQPFEKMPLRYDRAYGGCDEIALVRHGDPTLKALGSIEPEWHLERATRYHYPRNPTGMGYVIEADPESVEALELPNLEFPFDPITPERLAVGNWRAWLSAPLPAGFDWYGPGWFPRVAYLGVCPRHDTPQGPVSEAVRGWMPPEIVTEELRLHKAWVVRFSQGASPGLSIPKLEFDAELTLRHLFPDARERRVKLPGQPPKVTIEVSATERKAAETRLNAVVLQPDAQQLVLVWNARAKVSRPYAEPHLANMRWQTA